MDDEPLDDAADRRWTDDYSSARIGAADAVSRRRATTDFDSRGIRSVEGE
jgi:hypothetical protein